MNPNWWILGRSQNYGKMRFPDGTTFCRSIIAQTSINSRNLLFYPYPRSQRRINSMGIPKRSCHNLFWRQNRFLPSSVAHNFCASIIWTVLWFWECNGTPMFHRSLWIGAKSLWDCGENVLERFNFCPDLSIFFSTVQIS